jgi:hypothetical protein
MKLSAGEIMRPCSLRLPAVTGRGRSLSPHVPLVKRSGQSQRQVPALPKLAFAYALRAVSQAMRFCPTLPVQGRRGVLISCMMPSHDHR